MYIVIFIVAFTVIFAMAHLILNEKRHKTWKLQQKPPPPAEIAFESNDTERKLKNANYENWRYLKSCRVKKFDGWNEQNL